MNLSVDARAVELGEYIAESGATVRSAAKKFGISKSTVHKDVTERLRTVDARLWGEVRAVLENNKAQRHIRGGMATKKKYSEKSGKKKKSVL
ncbi:MAG: sporulation transcriptional regulator SpoIIID [Clostridia bacterium]|nr:sporulation transcriptional regulator SpoIIID [Clostridia bacterium]